MGDAPLPQEAAGVARGFPAIKGLPWMVPGSQIPMVRTAVNKLKMPETSLQSFARALQPDVGAPSSSG